MTPPSPLVAWLTFTLYLGAANYDSTEDERARLRESVLPMLPGLKAGTVTAKEILAVVDSIMPPGWVPPEPWLTQIVRLWKGSNDGQSAEGAHPSPDPGTSRREEGSGGGSEGREEG